MTDPGKQSEPAGSEMPASVPGEVSPGVPSPVSFPPYPPYIVEPAPPSLADAIIAGNDLRVLHKSVPKKPVRPPPRPAGPRGPKVTDANAKLTKQAMRKYERCLRCHGTALTDRLSRISKPQRRKIIYLWREYAQFFPPETISRLRAMLDADEPFKPDQAYEYFVNLQKSKKKPTANARVKEIKKDILSLYSEKRFLWARNATVAFAKGIQQRLSKPGRYALADGMLRLSNIILDEICGYMHMRTPSRRNNHPKAKFMVEMADKVAVWIDEILSESDDRMLMMDFDEDEDVIGPGGDANFEDDFLDMMGGDGGGGRGGKKALLKSPPAYLQFTGPMLESFNILTDSMEKKGDANLITHGKYNLSYAKGAEELKKAPDLKATLYNSLLANQINNDLTDTSKAKTPSHLEDYMKDIVDIASKYLSQTAEENKDKGPAFKLLVKTMKTKPREQLFQKDKIKKTYDEAAKQLENARGLETDHDDPNLTGKIYSSLKNLMAGSTPDNMKQDMEDALQVSSKYLSEQAVDALERGPAFDILIEELEHDGNDHFCDLPSLATQYAAAQALKSAPGLTSVVPDPKTVPMFTKLLHDVVDDATPAALKQDMDGVIKRCAGYLSAYMRDRDAATQKLLTMMKSKPKEVFATRPTYTMDYNTGAKEIETAPALTPYHPVKDIADEGKANLTRDMQNVTPPDLKVAVKVLINDASKHLSQPFALRSGVAGDRYKMEFLAAVKKSLGQKPLFKYKDFGQSYAEAADTLMHSGPLETGTRPSTMELHHQIKTEMDVGVPKQLAPTVAAELHPTMATAAQHLANVGTDKANTLDQLVGMMKEKKDTPLAELQGYPQTYTQGAKRLQDATTLETKKVELKPYQQVREKLTEMTKEKPDIIPEKHAKHMEEIIDKSSKFLAEPAPETEAEKRRAAKKAAKEGGDEDTKARKAAADAKAAADQAAAAAAKLAADPAATPAEKAAAEQAAKAAAEAAAAAEKAAAEKAAAEKAAAEKDAAEKAAAAAKAAADPGATAAEIQAANEAAAAAAKAAAEKAAAEKAAAEKAAAEKAAAEKAAAEKAAAGTDAADKAAAEKAAADKAAAEKAAAEKAAAAAKAAADQAAAAAAKAAADPSATDAEKAAASQAAAAAAKAAADQAAAAAAKAGADSPTAAAAKAAAEKAAAEKAAAEKAAADEKAAAARKAAADQAAAAAAKGGPGSAAAAAKAAAEAKASLKGLEFDDPEKAAALGILHEQLIARGEEEFYAQSHVSLSHKKASEWLIRPTKKVDKKVKESGDTARLHKKFEKKLGNLVAPVTPPNLFENMQDVIIESARQLSENFVAESYEGQASDALISAMQARGNEILIEVDNAAETTFFAAQRLKKAKQRKTVADEPCTKEAPRLAKKLNEIMKHYPVPRKIIPTVVEHTIDAANYLSSRVTKPDDEIEAYVALLEAMEEAGDMPLIEGEIPKTHEEAASYLRQLTSFEDKINCPNRTLQTQIQTDLGSLMSDVPPVGYTQPVMNQVIKETAGLLTSYVTLQAKKTEALKVMVEKMDESGAGLLLSHGCVRKSLKDGADLLRGKNTDQLVVPNADPVVARKVEIKLNNLMEDKTPIALQPIMEGVIEDATQYLGVHLVEPQLIKICKCMKNEFVQCELWCDEALRRVTKPPCTCSRHVSVQEIEELSPTKYLQICPGTSRAFPGVEIAVTECPKKNAAKPPCPAAKPTDECHSKHTTSYLMYSTVYNRNYGSDHPTRIPPQTSYTPKEFLDEALATKIDLDRVPPFQSLLSDVEFGNKSEQDQSEELNDTRGLESHSTTSVTHQSRSVKRGKHTKSYPQASTTTCPQVYTQGTERQTPSIDIEKAKTTSNYSCRTPILTVSTDQMGDWHAMMVSLMWNVQAWRKWIRENIDAGLAYVYDPNKPTDETADSWISFQKRVTTEALQWRQYNIFSRQLTLRLVSRYSNKEILSPSRATVKTECYEECASEMIDIIDMFNRWTQWLVLVVKEAGSLVQTAGPNISLQAMRWNHYKNKIVKYSNDWIKYNMHLNVGWEKKYQRFVPDYALNTNGPVWVVSACGAVPSGAVAGGMYNGEVIWIARTTHRCNVLPAALHPSNHCCLVYADGAVYHYTKYQVMCNAEVNWVPWRGGAVATLAIRVTKGVYIGRVLYRGSHLIGPVHAPHYRCHVVIFGRPFAFNCYEILALTKDSDQ